MADEIRADYNQLNDISTRFGNGSQAIQEMMQSVQNSMGALKDGWIGRGSEAFFSEMEQTVLPGVKRLQEALQEASQVTRNIAQVMQQAEDEAASPFRGMSGG